MSGKSPPPKKYAPSSLVGITHQCLLGEVHHASNTPEQRLRITREKTAFLLPYANLKERMLLSALACLFWGGIYRNKQTSPVQGPRNLYVPFMACILSLHFTLSTLCRPHELHATCCDVHAAAAGRVVCFPAPPVKSRHIPGGISNHILRCHPPMAGVHAIVNT